MTQKKFNSEEEKKLVENVFDIIKKKSTTSDELRHYRENCIKEKTGISFDENKYPEIKFKISANEIQQNNIFGENGDEYISKLENGLLSEKITDTFTKLLYAMAWKQGNLPKLKSIIDGILKADEEEISQDNAQVFYQFGKNLAIPEKEPIVDQNILRVFTIYKSLDNTQKKQKENISKYKEWLNALTINMDDKVEFYREVDKLLFVVGKGLKPSKKIKLINAKPIKYRN